MVDVPLLIEGGIWKFVGEVVVVYVYVSHLSPLSSLSSPLIPFFCILSTPCCRVVLTRRNEKLQLSRLLDRPSDPPLTPLQAQSRINSQLSLSSKLSYATQVVDNSGTLSDLENQVDRLVKRWKIQQGGENGWWWRVCWLVPPVGLAAGGICLVQNWWSANKRSGRRRGRGEVSAGLRKGGDEDGERIEMRDRGIGRRRGTGSSASSE